MPLTSPELVRAHLVGLRLGESRVTGETLTLSAATPAQLTHTGIKSGSVVVKARQDVPIGRETRVLAGDWVSLSHSRLIPHSVLIAADTSLTRIYTENSDFTVDAEGGRILRLESGAIPSGDSVVVWYEHYLVYTAGDDYTVDELEGQIRRTTTGAIADGQRVEVDYTIAPGNIPDAALDNAIAEASEAVLAYIDPLHHQSPTPGLVIGETHWAVAALCRMRAAAILAESLPGVQSLADSWIALGAQYDQSGRRHLAPYARPIPSRHSPRIN